MGIILRSAIAGCLFILTQQPARAEVVTDGTLGPAGALIGPDYAIGADLGRQLGGNLFHSFSRFSLGSAETALFLGPGSVRHIIGRVTGGGVSQIDGGLISDIPGASLWLINPAGMLFGPNAWIDVDGAVHVGTADRALFTDGSRFDALTPGGSTLTMAAPEGFGFLGGPAAAVQVDNAWLQVADGETLSLVGGGIRLTQAGGDPGSLNAPGGRIDLVAVQGNGEVRFGPTGPELSGKLQGAPILLLSVGSAALLGGTLVDTSGEGGGDLFIRGGELVLNGAVIASQTLGAVDGGVLELQVDSLKIDRGGQVDAGGDGSGRGSDILIRAGSGIRITGEGADGFSAISSGTFGPGPGGDIQIETPLLLIDGGSISNRPEDTGIGGSAQSTLVGEAGDIRLRVGRLRLVNNGDISTSTFGAQAAGSIHIQADDSVVVGSGGLEDESNISADSFGSGHGGDILIQTPDLLVNGGAVFAESLGDDGGATPGAGGNILLQVDRLVLRDGGRISSTTYSSAAGGDMDIQASESVTLDGRAADDRFPLTAIASDTLGTGDAGKLRIQTGVLRVLSAEITSESAGDDPLADLQWGNGGNIDIGARQVILEQGGNISSTTFSAGDSGDVSIRADEQLVVRGSDDGEKYSGIFANNQGDSGAGGQVDIQAGHILLSRGGIAAITDGSGPSGNILIQARSMQIENGGGMGSSTFGAGNGGRIVILLDQGLRMSGRDSSIESQSVGAGSGGSVRIAAANIRLDNGAFISSEGHGEGAAGNLSLAVGSTLELRNGSAVLARAATSGGEISISAGDLLYLAHSTISAAAEGAERTDDGGNVRAQRPLFLVLNDSRILARAVGGDGGDIQLAAQSLITDPNSRLDASSDLGVSGKIVVDAPESELIGRLRTPRLVLQDQPQLLEDPCRRLRYGEAGSSLVVNPGQDRFRIRGGHLEMVSQHSGDCPETAR